MADIVPDFLARVIDAWLEDADGERIENVERGEPIRLDAVIEARQDLVNPRFALHVNERRRSHVFELERALEDGEHAIRIDAGTRVRISAADRESADARALRRRLLARLLRNDGGRRMQAHAAARLRRLRAGRGQGVVSIPGELDVEIERVGRGGDAMSADAARSSCARAGPSALGGGWRRFGELLYLISVTEFKKTYFGTVLGYVWSLLRPLLLFAVLLFVFTKIVRLGSACPHYPVLLLMNVVLFGFFSEATATAVMSVVNQEGVVRKTQFPRLVIPLSVVLTSLFNLAVNLVVVLIFLARLRRLTRLDLAAVPADRPRCSSSSRRRSRCCSPRSMSASATRRSSGRSSPRRSSTPRR